jgi:hypothetical protein
MENINLIIDFIKGNNGNWIQTLISGFLLNITLWLYLIFLFYFIKNFKKKIINYLLIIITFFLIIFEFNNISVRQKYEINEYKVHLIKPTTENLIIVVQGANNPIKDVVKSNEIQVDKTSSRDYDGLGMVEKIIGNDKNQVFTFVGTHTFNLTPEKIITIVNDFKLFKPNGKIILVGHSVGAYNITQSLNEFKKLNIDINLVILIDAANKKNNYYNFIVEENVKTIINYTSPKWSDNLKFFTNSGGKVTLSKHNKRTDCVNIEIKGVEHTTIDNKITNLVIGDINNFLIKN